jgi:hypothetical protein
MNKTLLDFEIDKLTNSIESSLSGEVFETEIVKIGSKEKKQIKKSAWIFNWEIELREPSRDIFKLSIVHNSDIIQGLMGIEDKKDHIFLHLLESSNFNKGKKKLFFGVAGNLVAFACKISFEKGYEGFVAFDSKTALIRHYQQSLGATHFRGQRMFIETISAENLVKSYFGGL